MRAGGFGWIISGGIMHEVSIMESAVRMAVDAAKSAGASRVLALRLRVGTLSGAVPEALRFAFDVVCRDTIAEGASLEMDDRSRRRLVPGMPHGI